LQGLDLSVLGYGQLSDCCEEENESSVSLKFGVFYKGKGWGWLNGLTLIFYIHGSVNRDSVLIRSNEMKLYAGVYLLQNYSTCFGYLSHTSSGVRQTVIAASGTGHSVRE
jgi:hypothetical protein